MVKLALSAFGIAPLFYLLTGMCLAVFTVIYTAVYVAASRAYYRVAR